MQRRTPLRLREPGRGWPVALPRRGAGSGRTACGPGGPASAPHSGTPPRGDRRRRPRTSARRAGPARRRTGTAPPHGSCSRARGVPAGRGTATGCGCSDRAARGGTLSPALRESGESPMSSPTTSALPMRLARFGRGRRGDLSPGALGDHVIGAFADQLALELGQRPEDGSRPTELPTAPTRAYCARRTRRGQPRGQGPDWLAGPPAYAAGQQQLSLGASDLSDEARRIATVSAPVASTVPTIQRMSLVWRLAIWVRTAAISVRCSARDSASSVRSSCSLAGATSAVGGFRRGP